MLTLQLPGDVVEWWHATVAGGGLSERCVLRDGNARATIFFGYALPRLETWRLAVPTALAEASGGASRHHFGMINRLFCTKGR